MVLDIPDVPPDPEIVQQPEFLKGRQEFDPEAYKAIFQGIAVLPNFEPMPLWQVADIATSFYGTLRGGSYAKLTPTGRPHPIYNHRALYMLSHGQMRGWNGAGHVIISRGYESGDGRILSGKFAICQHKHVEGAGANHQRGWHPGYCEKCGLDMSVDSGD